MRRAWALATIAACSCFSPTYPTGLGCSPSGACPPNQMCDHATNMCVVPGTTPDASPRPVDAGPLPDGRLQFDASGTCTPSCLDANTYDTCGGTIACPLGCSSQGGPHCRDLVPSNGLSRADVGGAAADLVLMGGRSGPARAGGWAAAAWRRWRPAATAPPAPGAASTARAA